MINCHAHIFTIDHVPKNFLPLGLPTLMRAGLIRKPLAFLTDKLWPFSNKDQLSRLAAFIEATYNKKQEDLLETLAGYYPSDTQFVILPMDMEFQGAGRVRVSLEGQLRDLAQIKSSSKWSDRLLPFVPVDPRRTDVLDLVRRYIEEHHFSGVKLYPALGYWACDPRLFPVYEYCEDHEIPIITHCARGGVYFKGKLKKFPDLIKHPLTGETYPRENNRIFTDRLGDPDQFRHVLKRFPQLKINFAHYGGGNDWSRYLTNPWRWDSDHRDDRDVSVNWVRKINRLIRDTRYPNIFTDVSYTLHEERFVPLLKMFLNDDVLRQSILFGTDFYMLERDVSEKEIAVKFRFWIGEKDFKKIAIKNNKAFLGL